MHAYHGVYGGGGNCHNTMLTYIIVTIMSLVGWAFGTSTSCIFGNKICIFAGFTKDQDLAGLWAKEGDGFGLDTGLGHIQQATSRANTSEGREISGKVVSGAVYSTAS